MHRNKLMVRLVVSAGCISAFVISAGCSDTERREAGKEVLEAVQRTQRLYDQALSLMASPPFKVGEEFAPLPRESSTIREALRLQRKLEDLRRQAEDAPDAAARGKLHEEMDTIRAQVAEKIRVEVPEPLNPKALEVLKQADDGTLERILRDREAAPGADTALGYATLARVSMLKGQYYAAWSFALRGEARRALGGVEGTLASMGAYSKLISFFQELAASNDRDVDQVVSSATAEAAQTAKKIQGIDLEVASLKAKTNRLRSENLKLRREVEGYHEASRNATGTDRLRWFDKVRQLQAKMHENRQQIVTADDRLTALDNELGFWRTKQAAAKAVIALGQQIREDRGDRRKVYLAKRDEFVRSVADGRENGLRLLEVAADACQEAKKVEDEMIKAYQLAANRLAKAGAAQPGVRSPELLALQAGALMAEGNVYARALELQAYNDRVTEQMKAIWAASTTRPATVPASVGRLQAYLSDREVFRQSAEAKFRQAVDLYQKARRQVGRSRNAWMYQAGLAAANVALEEVQGP